LDANVLDIGASIAGIDDDENNNNDDDDDGTLVMTYSSSMIQWNMCTL